MKIIQTIIIAGFAFFLSAGISYGAELDDLDVTIRMVESDDIVEMQNELSLPEAEDGEHDLARTDEVHESEHGNETEQENEQEDSDEARDEHEDQIDDRDEAREDQGDLDDERDEANEEEGHEEDHENVIPGVL